MINKLSPRESQVLTLVLAGQLNKQIAHELGTTERTIKAHRHNMMSKLNAHSFAELFAFTEQAVQGRATTTEIKPDPASHPPK